jgi:hypothetical protein
MVSEEILEFSFKQLIIELDELTGVRSLSSNSASLNRPLLREELAGGWWMRLSSDGDRFGTSLLESK